MSLLTMGVGGADGPSIRPEIQVILNLTPFHYCEMRFMTDPVLGQLLYQDSAGTIPVTAIGQPIGYAKNLGTADPTHLVYPFIASFPANFPLYTGTTLGGDFRVIAGEAKELFISGVPAFQYPVTIGNHALSLGNDGGPSGTDDSAIWLTGSVGGNVIVGLLLGYQPSLDDQFWEMVQLDTPNVEVFIGAATPPASRDALASYITVFVQGGTDSCYTRENGSGEAVSDPLTVNPSLTILSMAAASEGAPFNGYQANIALWVRELSPADQAVWNAQVIP